MSTIKSHQEQLDESISNSIKNSKNSKFLENDFSSFKNIEAEKTSEKSQFFAKRGSKCNPILLPIEQISEQVNEEGKVILDSVIEESKMNDHTENNVNEIKLNNLVI